jgi:poly(3-hydroxybutyrate) depolymerase
MKKPMCLPVVLLILAACGQAPAPEKSAPNYDLDAARISVSGLSSGAYMAGQLHLAHSRLFSGAAIFAGGPYYCAENSLQKGIGPCVKGGEMELERLLAYAAAREAAGEIDALANLADDNVWVFHGTLDTVVGEAVTAAAIRFYQEFLPADSISYVNNVAVVHGLPTLQYGLPCDTFGTPFLHACNYDAAGTWLRALHGELRERVAASGELMSIAQPGGEDAGMLPQAFLYVPEACAAGEHCGLHVALHGCSQSAEKIGDAFASGSGLNEWAESNRLLVLYPQVGSSTVAPMNPYGCWDWWGYTDEHYATRNGRQVQVIKATIDQLAGRTL